MATGKQAKRNFIISMIVVVTMLVSGMYYLSSMDTGSQTTQQYTLNKPQYTGYAVNMLDSGDKRLIVEVESMLPEYVAMPTSRCVSYQVIDWVYNISILGLGKPVLESGNPVESGENICGEMFIFFRFPVISKNNETEKLLKQQLDNRLGNYFLKKTYSGTINTSGVEALKLNIIGSTEVGIGDTVEVIVFQSMDNRLIALEKKRLYLGPIVPATVLSETGLIAQGIIGGELNMSGIENEFNTSLMRINSAKISVNTTLDNETIDTISNLTGVNIVNQGNTSEIQFNQSLSELKAILDKENITYGLVEGSGGMQLPLNLSVEKIKSVLEGAGFTGIEIQKSALISLPSEVLFGESSAAIQNNDNYSALIEFKSKAGDKINVTLSAIQFGDQYLIAGAQETI